MTKIERVYAKAAEFAEGPHGRLVREYLARTSGEDANALHQLGSYVILYTPPRVRPPLMLIADRPSWFDEFSPEKALANLADVAAKIPSVNSYLDHDHKFARFVKSAFEEDKEYLLETCVGLNRFWFQTGPNFSAPSNREHPDLRAAWRKAVAHCKEGTRELIEIVNPRSVALIGGGAQEAVRESFRARHGAIVFEDCRDPARGGQKQFVTDLKKLIEQAGL
ncbi:MAG: hypothetical protein HQL40_02955 [Alphaproteobacteria bacterium]|nr:hypothetical protein [Alphaproteobacteria bacterium]